MTPTDELLSASGHSYPLLAAADGAARRRGLLDYEHAPAHGLLLRRCPLVHMLGMSFALDIVFVDGAGRVRRIYAGVRPGLRLRGSLRGRSCIELPAGVAADLSLAVGERVEIRPLDQTA